ncbi:hypothetical protein KC19_VG116000 [Ceratodon purpureus]|uniref:Uncharacterized protein n=1 Tax=Ceratodon purpureus TaxID=3225 RepID=A0A8T0HP68_CERPU|nr:hypothetical protein KC19_VG116000 [Ceratodon purpureus]
MNTNQDPRRTENAKAHFTLLRNCKSNILFKQNHMNVVARKNTARTRSMNFTPISSGKRVGKKSRRSSFYTQLQLFHQVCRRWTAVTVEITLLIKNSYRE